MEEITGIKKLPEKGKTAEIISRMTKDVNNNFIRILGATNTIEEMLPEEAYWISEKMFNCNYIKMFLQIDYVSMAICVSKLRKGVENEIINVSSVILWLLELDTEKPLICPWGNLTRNKKTGEIL